jgi:hypothetical protein
LQGKRCGGGLPPMATPITTFVTILSCCSHISSSSKNNITTTHASCTQSCQDAIKHYQNYHAAICHYCAVYYAHLFMKEIWLGHVLLPRLNSYSYFGDALQNAKQLFSVRLPLMTKYFVMRECENILSRCLCVVTTAFSQQDVISIFKFHKSSEWFFEISCRDLSSLSTLFLFLSI